MSSRASAHGSRRRIMVALGLGALVASAAAWVPVLPAAPAVAHASLIATAPADGDRIAAAPTEVSLQFSEDLIEMGVIVRVVDAAGVDHAAGDPVIEGSTVVTTVDPSLPSGAIEMRWRVVSADGHPISGVTRFTIEGGNGPEPASASSPPTAIPAATLDEASQAAGGADAQDATDMAATGRTALLAAGGAVVALLLLLGVGAVRRRLRIAKRET